MPSLSRLSNWLNDRGGVLMEYTAEQQAVLAVVLDLLQRAPGVEIEIPSHVFGFALRIR